MKPKQMIRAYRLVLCRSLFALLLLGSNSPARTEEIRELHLDPVLKELRLGAVSHPGRFQGWSARLLGTSGHHLLTWENGRRARFSLLTTPVDDRTVYDALVQIGGNPGNALTRATWDARRDPGDPAPDLRIKGSPIRISLTWEGLPSPIPLGDVLDDPGGRGFDFRFGGHKELIEVWNSGCIVCLYGCPGGKIGNAAYTIRDQIAEAMRFRIRQDTFPPDGTPVTVILRLEDDPSGPER
jgi:hypothetical protein